MVAAHHNANVRRSSALSILCILMTRHPERGHDKDDVGLAHLRACSIVGVRRSPRTSPTMPPTKAPGSSPIAAPTAAPAAIPARASLDRSCSVRTRTRFRLPQLPPEYWFKSPGTSCERLPHWRQMIHTPRLYLEVLRCSCIAGLLDLEFELTQDLGAAKADSQRPAALNSHTLHFLECLVGTADRSPNQKSICSSTSFFA